MKDVLEGKYNYMGGIWGIISRYDTFTTDFGSSGLLVYFAYIFLIDVSKKDGF